MRTSTSSGAGVGTGTSSSVSPGGGLALADGAHRLHCRDDLATGERPGGGRYDRRLSVTQPLAELWRTVGNCGSPPTDQSRQFAVVAIALHPRVWIVLPLLVTLSLAG